MTDENPWRPHGPDASPLDDYIASRSEIIGNHALNAAFGAGDDPIEFSIALMLSLTDDLSGILALALPSPTRDQLMVWSAMANATLAFVTQRLNALK